MNFFKFLLNIFFYERIPIRNTHLIGSADLTVTQIINLPTWRRCARCWLRDCSTAPQLSTWQSCCRRPWQSSLAAAGTCSLAAGTTASVDAAMGFSSTSSAVSRLLSGDSVPSWDSRTIFHMHGHWNDCEGWVWIFSENKYNYAGTVDPHLFFVDPDLAFFLNADPDPVAFLIKSGS